jgi:hypothetical protein
MVLGVDDMIQDFVYHRHQVQWLARDTIGYGTLSGLHVEVVTRDPAKGPEVAVSPGTALSPRGQLIRVVPRQCAALNQWLGLADTQQKLREHGVLLNGASSFTAYVVLCFRDCPVDPLPIPGEPCRCADEAMAPSRILDDFRLELRFAPPAQPEEDAIRDFVQWLRQVRIEDGTFGYSSLEEFLAGLRSAAHDLLSPVDSPPDFLYGSPPQNLAIPGGQLCEYLQAALRLWVTELRPLWQAHWSEKVGGGCGCHGDEHSEGQDAEECLLLAALDLPLLNGQVAPGQPVPVNEDRRPFVVHLRLLQELLLCGPRVGGSSGCKDRTFATAFALDDHTLRIWVHHPQPITFESSAVLVDVDDVPVTGFTVSEVTPGEASNVFDLDLGVSPPVLLQFAQRIRLLFDLRLVFEVGSPPLALADVRQEMDWCYTNFGNEVVEVFAVAQLPAEPPIIPPGVTDHGDLTGLANDDHTQYLLVNGTRALTGNLSAGGNRLTGLAAATANGQAVRFEQAVKNGDAAGGDLAGTYPAPEVQALQGRAVADVDPPADGVVLTWNSAGQGRWEPRAIPAGGITIREVAQELPTWDFATITLGPRSDDVPTFDLWFHLNAGPTFTRGNLPELTTFPDNAIAIFAETDQQTPSPPFLSRRAIKSTTRIGRNVFRVLMANTQVDKDLLLRFIFAIGEMGVRGEPAGTEIAATDWIGERPVKWLGHDGAKSITTFYRQGAQASAAGMVPVAAGRFGRDGAALSRVLGGATAIRNTQIDSSFFIQFNGYNPQNTYIVTGTPVVKIPSDDSLFTFEVGDSFGPQGIPVWIRPGVPSGGFMVQIDQIL